MKNGAPLIGTWRVDKYVRYQQLPVLVHGQRARGDLQRCRLPRLCQGYLVRDMKGGPSHAPSENDKSLILGDE